MEIFKYTDEAWHQACISHVALSTCMNQPIQKYSGRKNEKHQTGCHKHGINLQNISAS